MDSTQSQGQVLQFKRKPQDSPLISAAMRRVQGREGGRQVSHHLSWHGV